MYVCILYIIHTYVSHRRYPAISCGAFYLDILAFLCVPRIPMGSLRVFRLGLLWDFLRWFPMWRSLWGVGCPMDPSMRAIMGRPVGIPYGGVYWVLGFPNGGFLLKGFICGFLSGFRWIFLWVVIWGFLWGPYRDPYMWFPIRFHIRVSYGDPCIGFPVGFPIELPIGFPMGFPRVPMGFILGFLLDVLGDFLWGSL